MCDHNDVFSLFTSHLCNYFNGKCPESKCSLVKKHRDKIEITGDFSVILNKNALRKHSRTCEVNDTPEIDESEKCIKISRMVDSCLDSPHVHMQISEDLLSLSRNWPFLIDKCSILQERLLVYLQKASSFKTLLHLILSQGSTYGENSQNSEVVFLSTDLKERDKHKMNLTEYRIHYVASVIKNLLRILGYSVFEEDSNTVQKKCLNIVVGCLSSSCVSDSILIRCGDVYNERKESHEEMLMEDCLKLKYEQLEKISLQKYGEQVETEVNWYQFLKQLSEATINFELLSVRPTRSITMSFHPDHHTSSRGIPFILYNCARITAIRSQFEKYCNDGLYPPLVPLEEVDFSVLKKEEEWKLLAGYLMVYPSVLKSTVSDLREGQCYPNVLCQFLTDLCNSYSCYYHHVRVLVEPQAHLVPLIHARLYLLQAIEYVLHNGLRLLEVEPVSQM